MDSWKIKELVTSSEFWIGTVIVGLILNLISSVIYSWLSKRYQQNLAKKKYIKETFEDRREKYIKERIDFIGNDSSKLNTQINLAVYHQSSLKSMFVIGSVFYICGFILFSDFRNNDKDSVSTAFQIFGFLFFIAGHIIMAGVIKGFFSTFIVHRMILFFSLEKNGFRTYNEYQIKDEVEKELKNKNTSTPHRNHDKPS